MEIPVVALVGYTNAGKSTLMNQLSNAGVFAENMLFATLDPTTRKITLPKRTSASKAKAVTSSTETSLDLAKGQEIFLSDTVGFISKLPTNLIAAFRATLDEARYADILVVVCDRSNPVWKKQRQTVYQELAALQCDHEHKPIIELWNKIDLIPSTLQPSTPTDSLDVNSTELADPPLPLTEEVKLEIDARKSQQRLTQPFAIVSTSAKTGEGLNDLIQTIEQMIEEKLQQSITILIPYQESQHQYFLNQIHLQGKIHSIEHGVEGSRIECSLPPRLFDKVKGYQVR